MSEVNKEKDNLSTAEIREYFDISRRLSKFITGKFPKEDTIKFKKFV